MPVDRGGGGHSRWKKWEDCNSFTLSPVQGRGRNLAPLLIKSINSLFPGEKACQIS